jgi:mRNA degradation ribonuclease J1/J2
MLISHAELAKECKIKEKKYSRCQKIGQVVKLNQREIFIDKEKVPANYVMVDGLGVGDVGGSSFKR